jgi:molybdopterin converting factor small subunit
VTVEVRLFATLTQFLPPGSHGGSIMLDVPEGATVADVARRLGIPAGLDRVVLVNGHETDADHRMRAGDVLDMFPPLAGGRPAR